MKTILAPTDFSDISVNAAEYAAGMACVVGTSLTLIHVCSLPVAVNEVALPADTINQVIAEAEESMELLKEKLLLETKDRIKIYTFVTEGYTDKEIENYSRSKDIYAVVMGPETAGGLRQFIDNASTLHAVKHFECPVLIVPANIKFANIKKIGLACDYENVINTIPMLEINTLVKAFNAELHVIHIAAAPDENLSKPQMEEYGLLKEILKGIEPVYHFVYGDNAAHCISEFADQEQLDLLIILPKRHSVLSRLLRGSHSKQLVLQSHIPVLSVHE